MRRAWAAAWPYLGIGACAFALAFIPRDAWWWGLAAGSLLGAANVIGQHEGRRYVRGLRSQLDAAWRIAVEQAGKRAAADTGRSVAEATLRTLRDEVAALRRQNLALDAQLDHMTRVNQSYDAGITTTSTQERT